MRPSPLTIDQVPASPTKGECPSCGSKDNCMYYPDGHLHCFSPSCNFHTGPLPELADPNYQRTTRPPPVTTPAESKLLAPERMQPIAQAYRGIKAATFQRYEYRATTLSGGKDAHVWPIYNQDGALACQRLRLLAKKDFMVLHGTTGDQPNACQLFGRTVWGDANDKRVVITEGELDAMSIAQCASFKYPVVSVNGGAQSAAACLKANYKWLDRFDEIILWLDDDKEGQAATAECVKLFSVGKVKIAKIAGFKDANEALQANKFAEIEQAVYAATTWRPKGVLNAADTLGLLLNRTAKPYWQWPYPSLQKHTGGILRGKVIYHVAGTGVGKTTSLLECLVHCVNGKDHTEEPAKIGYIGFETDMEELLQDLLTVVARRRLKLDPLDDKATTALHNELFGSRRWELFDPTNAEWSFEACLSYVRYMVKVCDCNIIVIDPLSALVALLPGNEDERRALDKVAMTLALLSKELNVAIHIAHHLTRPSEGAGHEEGGRVSLKQVRGSGGVSNHADGVLGYERNQQADEETAKTVTTMRALKWRFTGFTGVACYTQYDTLTGQTYEITEQEAKRLLGNDAGHGKKAPATSEFAGMEDDDQQGADF